MKKMKNVPGGCRCHRMERQQLRNDHGNIRIRHGPVSDGGIEKKDDLDRIFEK